MTPLDRLTHETTELLQQLIRNGCVNDGTRESGEETRNADVLTGVLEGAGLDVVTFTRTPGRANVVARIDGTDASAPTLLLLGHTDVVPAVGDHWREDPFGGELLDGEVWGRGALDMLCLTASMAVATRHLADTGWRPRGSLVFAGVADEEAGGRHGARWLVDEHWDAVACDYVLTELGGAVEHTPAGRHVSIGTAEKGVAQRRVVVHGSPGHGSMPWGADNALVTAAEVVRRIAAHGSTPQVGDHWRAYVSSLALPHELERAVLDPGRLRDHIGQLPPATQAFAHACTHMTLSPNVAHGGLTTSTIADRVVLELDVRTLPGQDVGDVDAELRAALGDLHDRVVVEAVNDQPATSSPVDTPLYELLRDRLVDVHPGATVQPMLEVGATDATFFRRRGVTAYGAGAFSERTPLPDLLARFHGRDERVDVDSLRLQTQLWLDVADGLLT